MEIKQVKGWLAVWNRQGYKLTLYHILDRNFIIVLKEALASLLSPYIWDTVERKKG